MRSMSLVHIIGAGISGLAAATALAEAHVPVRVYEASASAGGRARSSRDGALGSIDHGLHFLQGECRELRRYLARIQSPDALTRIPHPLALSAAPLIDYLDAFSLLTAKDGLAYAQIEADNILADGWLSRAARAWLHTPFHTLSTMAAARALRSALRHPRAATKAHVPTYSIEESFISPALAQLDYCGASVYFNQPLKSLQRSGGRISGLTFARQKLPIAEGKIVILATPSHITRALLPEVSVKGATHSSITLHYQAEHREAVPFVVVPESAPVDLVKFTPGRISAMIRVAEGAWHSDPGFLAQRIWRWLVAQYPYLTPALPAYACWREKQAGYLLTPEREVRIAPLPAGLILAGDWLERNTPATLEAAVTSGHNAAAAALRQLPKIPYRHQ